MQKHCIKSSSNTCFGYLSESPQREAILTKVQNICSMGNKNKTRPFLHIILSIKDSLQQQIHYNGNIFWEQMLSL